MGGGIAIGLHESLEPVLVSNDDNESALKDNLLRSVVVCIVAARHSG